jgi:hypothetical protein
VITPVADRRAIHCVFAIPTADNLTVPLAVLRAQGAFLAGLPLCTHWARQLFPRELIQAKAKEAEQLLRLLQTEPASRAGG